MPRLKTKRQLNDIEVLRLLKLIDEKLNKLIALDQPPSNVLKELAIQFRGGNVNMPGTDPLGDTIPATLTGVGTDGKPFTLTVADLSVTTDNPAVATVTQDPTTGQPTFT